jgi:hypothetical protein
MDFKTVRDKTAAVLSNPRILTFTLIGTTTLLIGAFLFFGNDDETGENNNAMEEPVADFIPDSAAEATAEATEAIASPFNMFANQDDGEQPPQQTGGKRRKKTRRGKKQKKSRSTKRKFL